MSLSSLAILPQPFAWIKISAGQVKIISDDNWKNRNTPQYKSKIIEEIFEVATFEIAKYPLTNAQFAKFIEAKGYQQHQWWTEAGWHTKEQHQWTEPLFWHDSKFNKRNYPVVGISWYEAIAFCQWLSSITEEKITLPTEQQWQHAAQGDSDRQVAWGNIDDEEIHANWDSEGTTPVTQYEGTGNSPFGVVDMTGNVWECCLTKYENKESDLEGMDGRVARGGGWMMLYSHELNIRVTDRMYISPIHRLNYLGFRCARF
jgi:formylglycine-generating enzyme required for sulfatase activity